MNEFRIVPLSEVGVGDACRLLASSLSDTGLVRKTGEYWAWKHLENPVGASIGFAAYSSDGKLACLRPMMKSMVRIPGGECMLALRPVDTATDAAYRGQGLFKKLTELALDEARRAHVALILNTPNQASLPQYLKLGWLCTGTFVYRVTPVPLLWLRGLIGRRLTTLDVVLSGSTNPETMAALQFCAQSGSMARFQGVGTMKDLGYLHWRYVRHPNGNYRLHATYDRSGDLAGCAIYRKSVVRRIPCTIVSEVFLAEGVGGSRLLTSLAARVRTPLMMLGGSVNNGAPLRSGLVPSIRATSAPIISKTLEAHSQTTLATIGSSWDFSIGDLETF